MTLVGNEYDLCMGTYYHHQNNTTMYRTASQRKKPTVSDNNKLLPARIVGYCAEITLTCEKTDTETVRPC